MILLIVRTNTRHTAVAVVLILIVVSNVTTIQQHTAVSVCTLRGTLFFARNEKCCMPILYLGTAVRRYRVGPLCLTHVGLRIGNWMR